MKLTIKNLRKSPKILTCSSVRFDQFIFLFVDGDISSVRVIISLDIYLIFLFVDGAVSCAIYYTTFFIVFSNATFTRSGDIRYSIQATGFTH